MKNIEEETPSFRAYGNKKREHSWLDILTNWLLRAVFLLAIAVPGFLAFVGILATIRYLPDLLTGVVFGLFFAIIIAICLTRTLRKRLKFMRKLKKACKKYGCSIQYEQNFFQSLVWSPDRQDFVIKTKKKTYYVRFLTLRKYRSTLFLEKEDELRLVKYPLRNIVTLVFDIKPKTKKYHLDFKVPTSVYDIPTVKALVVNPVCEEIKVRMPNGGYETTGSNGTHFGFTVFTGSGFLNELERERYV